MPYARKLEIGMWCEDRFRRVQKKEALARIEARSAAKREQQAKAHDAAARLARAHMQVPPALLARAVAGPAAQLDKLGRFDSEPLRRPKGAREPILRAAAREFKISIWAADRCWRLARRWPLFDCCP
jgi:hypothetical protein